MWELVPWPGIEPGPPGLGAWSLSHWTTRKVPFAPSQVTVWTLISQHHLLWSVQLLPRSGFCPGQMLQTQFLIAGLLPCAAGDASGKESIDRLERNSLRNSDASAEHWVDSLVMSRWRDHEQKHVWVRHVSFTPKVLEWELPLAAESSPDTPTQKGQAWERPDHHWTQTAASGVTRH